ncbi:MAG TPA: hypothetical protein VEX40_17905 [Mycobacterium sp.]|nr:hypothetical protein [Mycobacterium sp.]
MRLNDPKNVAGTLIAVPGVPDRYWGNSTAPLDDFPPSCVRPGLYRIEFYLNGVMRQQVDFEAAAGKTDFAPVLAEDLDIAFCRPTAWSETGTPGLSRAAASPDGSRGIVVVNIDQPLLATGDRGSVAIERALRLAPVGLPTGMSEPVALDPLTQPSFLFHRTPWQVRSYATGSVKCTTAPVSRTGSVPIVCVYGPTEWLSSAESAGLLVSVVQH